MDGEYGNIEVWIANHTWTDSANTSEVCRLYVSKLKRTYLERAYLQRTYTSEVCRLYRVTLAQKIRRSRRRRLQWRRRLRHSPPPRKWSGT